MKLFPFLSAVTVFCFALPCSAQSIKNPYYTTPQWKLWYADQTPITDQYLIAPGQPGKLTPTVPSERLYPDDDLAPGQFLHARKGDWTGRKYAGTWDDVYFTMDRAHTFFEGIYYGPGNNSLDLEKNFMGGNYAITQGIDYPVIPKFGTNFTSQSTTEMGSDLSNIDTQGNNYNSIYTPFGLEKTFYFQNALRAGPVASSYTDDDDILMNDTYHAYLPIYFNSPANSGSEMGAITKMMIVGGNLQTAMKNELKRNGLYMATLLYLWKTALPFDAPYESEIKHRNMYSSFGTGLVAGNNKANIEYHYYDEFSHMKNMVEMAKAMTVAPPITLLKKVSLVGGSVAYFIKTAALINQAQGEQIQLRVSVSDSFDLANKPLTFKAKLMQGSPSTTIVNEGGGNYLITVPSDPNLPAGKTTILFVANNGVYDSNPAAINIYKASGTVNKRPVFSGVEDKVIRPGDTLTFNIGLTDPEGYPTSVFKRTDHPGTINGKTYTWTTNSSTAPGDYKLTLLGTDGTGGTNSKVVTITVSKTVAKASANQTTGVPPLAVNFSSAGSSDMSNNGLTYSWNFDDGSTSTAANPSHTFTSPGIYKVRLTATGPLGSNTSFVNVEAGHAPWGLNLNNGWTANGLDSTKWTIEDPSKGSVGIGTGGELLMTPNLDVVRTAPYRVNTVASYSLPYYVETEVKFPQGQTGDGIELGGSRIGWDIVGINEANAWPNNSAAQYVNPAVIMNLQTKDIATIGHTIESNQSGAEIIKLRVYVSADPEHPGKARYHGFLTSRIGTYQIDFNNQDFTPGPIKIGGLMSWMKLPKQFFSFRVYKPGAAPTDFPPSPPMNFRVD